MVLSIFGISFEELYLKNLNSSSDFYKAELSLKSAEVEMKRIDQFFVPYVQTSLNTFNVVKVTVENTQKKDLEELLNRFKNLLEDSNISEELPDKLKDLLEDCDISEEILGCLENFLNEMPDTIDVETETEIGGIVFNSKGEIVGFGFSLDTAFVEVFGTNIGLSFPFKIYFKGDKSGFYAPWSTIQYKTPTEQTVEEKLYEQIAIVASRDLKKVDKADKLNTEAKYYSALSSYYFAQANVFITTVEDIFNRYYNEKMIEISQREIEILNNMYETATEEKVKEEIEKQILTAQKVFEGLKASNVSLEYFEFTEDLYNETRNLVDNIISQNSSVSKNTGERLDLKALKLSKEASDIQKKFWFLPYVPFSTLTFSVQPFNDFNWNVRIGFEMTIFDKGERKLAADTMKSELASLTYDESTKKIEELIRGLETNKKTLYYDINIAQINLKNAIEDYERSQDLYEKGFITQNDLTLSEITLQRSKLTLEKTENNLKVNELRLMQQYYVNLWGDKN